eukprot:Phypoly_transcript_14516.p1 GENE.Phypoly_transcript_14516~~Phypoly_transcript_14516.p1  ORF type:complete len:217 (+),score=43.00 Phypoly_transcript_14516:192-842(+)
MGGMFSKEEQRREEYRAKKSKSKPGLANRWKFYDKGRQPMVGWYASQLFKTGLDLLISTKLSSSHDVRIFNALQMNVKRAIHSEVQMSANLQENVKNLMSVNSYPASSFDAQDDTKNPLNQYHYIFPFEDESAINHPDGSKEEKKDLWIDFVADIGDGFDSCYTVTYKQTRPTLDVKFDPNTTKTTKRGSVLILGGDLAYPIPSVEAYDLRRLLRV